MNYDKNILADLLQKKLDEMPTYKESLALVKMNSEGKIWLIGGIVSRILISELFKVDQTEYDYDFLIEHLKSNIEIPSCWTVERKKHGNPTFRKGALEIDLFPISTHNYIAENHLEPNIDNFFRGVPFTIQALAYDVNSRQLVGDVGLAALKKRVYEVNNLAEAMRLVGSKGITLNERIEKKAKSLGFKPVLV